MGVKIDIFLNSFNDELLKAIEKKQLSKSIFDKTREEALKITDIRTSTWPNNSAIKTVGDLLGYSFPASGGIFNKPESYGPSNVDFLTYLEDINSEPSTKELYKLLNSNYYFNPSLGTYLHLKEKGGAQVWFDYFMYIFYNLFIKNDDFLKKASEELQNDGKLVSSYNTFDLFDDILINNYSVNNYKCVASYLTSNLSSDVMLYDAFIEAGDNYVGTYTKDIKTPVNFYYYLNGDDTVGPVPIAGSPSNTIAGSPSVAEQELIAGSPSNTAVIAGTPSAKIPLLIPDIPENLTIQAKTDMDSFYVYVGDVAKKVFDDFDNLGDLDEEYSEDEFKGIDDTVVEPDAPNEDVDGNWDRGPESSTYGSYVPTIINGGVKLPTGAKAYSHTTTQGYNLTDSKWYGDMVSSALAHIDHPTFDIADTKKGAYGCASWVSMVFYRAFGVSMKDGKAVKATPQSIGDFGSKGTYDFPVYFGNNPSYWDKIPIDEGMPGDIVNTASILATATKKKITGHVGVVLNEKDGDGTWKIASNSSAGFGSSADPQGCGRKNYSIKTWKSKNMWKNPSGTWCWRYKGPKLQPYIVA